MIYGLNGQIKAKGENFAVLELHGLSLKIFMPGRVLARLPQVGEKAELYTHLHVREDALELYGFADQAALGFFEQLISVSGVGPRSALAILDVADFKDIVAAVSEGRADLLTRASGVGRKTAERIVLELRGRVHSEKAAAAVSKMETDGDIVEALGGLGYRREEARAALEKIPPEEKSLEHRLKAALKILNKRK